MSIGRQVFALILFLLVVYAVAAFGSVFTAQAIPTWYATLDKPPWTPPNWLFAPVWTVLYAFIAIAGWLVWRRVEASYSRTYSLTMWGAQLFFNAIWTPIFFGLRQPGPAFAVIALLWLTILVCILAFWRVSKAAAILFIPYLLWVSYAAALNYAIWR